MPLFLSPIGDNTRRQSKESIRLGKDQSFFSLPYFYRSPPTTTHTRTMLGFSGNTTAGSSNRVRRAQQLRQQRMGAATKGSSPSKSLSPSSNQASPRVQENNKDDEIMVISGIWTLVAAVFIVFLGAAMAVVFFISYKPECMQGVFWGDDKIFRPGETIVTKVP
jgi:hypothetical protein